MKLHQDMIEIIEKDFTPTKNEKSSDKQTLFHKMGGYRVTFVKKIASIQTEKKKPIFLSKKKKSQSELSSKKSRFSSIMFNNLYRTE